MEIAIENEIAARPELHNIVARANRVLEATIGRAPHPPRAVWKLNANGDHVKPVALDLAYFDQSMATPFSVEELTDVGELRYRLFRIWGRLIVQNNRATTKEIVGILDELKEELKTPQGV